MFRNVRTFYFGNAALLFWKSLTGTRLFLFFLHLSLSLRLTWHCSRSPTWPSCMHCIPDTDAVCTALFLQHKQTATPDLFGLNPAVPRFQPELTHPSRRALSLILRGGVPFFKAGHNAVRRQQKRVRSEPEGDSRLQVAAACTFTPASLSCLVPTY